MRSDEALLLDMLIAARKIMRFLDDMNEDEFVADDMAQSAVIRELQVIGEAARFTSAETRDAYPQIDWPAMVGMRNRLVHGYFSIRLDVVWLTAQVDIPPLRNLLETIVLPEDKFEDEDRAV